MLKCIMSSTQHICSRSCPKQYLHESYETVLSRDLIREINAYIVCTRTLEQLATVICGLLTSKT